MKYPLSSLFCLLLVTSGPVFCEDETLPVLTCPPIENLVQDENTLHWGADQGHWRSYSISFAHEIKRFLGAQWNGANLGTVYCLYQGNPTTFTIKLQFDTLSYSPSGGKWSKDLGQFKNCISEDQADCPFVPLQKEAPKTLYQQLDDLKPKRENP